MDCAHVVKVKLIGAPGVGKSCLVQQATYSTFSRDHFVTTSVAFASTVVRVPTDGTKINVQLWDTPGTARFCCGQSAGVLLVYDITNRNSFSTLSHWVDDCLLHGDGRPELALIGNKTDRRHRRVVSTKEGQKLANRLGQATPFVELSAKSPVGINRLIEKLTCTIYQKNRGGDHAPSRRGWGPSIDQEIELTPVSKSIGRLRPQGFVIWKALVRSQGLTNFGSLPKKANVIVTLSLTDIVFVSSLKI